MAGTEPTVSVLEALSDKWAPIALQNARPLNPASLGKPKRNVKNELLKQKLLAQLDQRNQQREKIFGLAKNYCWTSLGLLIGVVVVQVFGRIFTPNHDFNVFGGSELQVLVVGVFGQFVGLLYIITKSLYDDSNYKDLFKDILNK